MSVKANHNQPLKSLLNDIRACTLCAPQLSHGARPILQVENSASILIAGQAPGAKVHASGIPFDDASGERLRDWMGVSCDIFYDASKVSILPMSFCYPGKGRSGDLPPMPVCADTWRKNILSLMPNIQLTLVIGQYAQAWHLNKRKESLTETVRNWQSYDERTLPLPHPSPRNNIWLKRNPWFEQELLPQLKTRVEKALGHQP